MLTPFSTARQATRWSQRSLLEKIYRFSVENRNKPSICALWLPVWWCSGVNNGFVSQTSCPPSFKILWITKDPSHGDAREQKRRQFFDFSLKIADNPPFSLSTSPCGALGMSIGGFYSSWTDQLFVRQSKSDTKMKIFIKFRFFLDEI